MNYIERDIFVLRDASSVARPIEYVQGTNAIPILLHFRDYTIPDGSTARVYVEWSSTKGEYDEDGVTIDGNDILIKPKNTLFSEMGRGKLQVCIVNGEDTLVTFTYPVIVKRNHVPGITDPSENHSDFLDEYLMDIEEKMEITAQQAEETALLEASATKSATAAKTSEINAKTSETNALQYMNATQKMSVTIVGDITLQISEEGILQAVYDDGL